MATRAEIPGRALTRLDTELFLSRLHDVCALDSPTGDVEAVDRVAGFLARWGEQAGLEADAFSTPMGVHLRLTLPGSGSGRALLVGHHDTVWPLGTGADRPLWIEGGRAMGPGSADMKAGLLVGLAAMERLAEGSREGFGAIELHSLPDEEARVGPPARADLFEGADAALVLECGRESGAFVCSRSGATWIEVEARGRAAHAGTDRALGRSALHAAAAEMARIEGLAEGRPDLWITATKLLSDGPANAVAGSARLTLDVRAESTEVLAWAVAEAARFGTHPGVELSATQASGFPPMPRSEELVAEVQVELGRAGAVAGAEHAGGASDGCWTASLGIPTVDGLGPVGGADHTEDEWIDVDSVGPRIGALVGICEAVGARAARLGAAV